MTGQAVTFDFHDTLVRCDAWFELEVRSLPSAFLVWHERHRGGFAQATAAPGLERSYRRLRTAIIEHGHELTAERSLAVVMEQAGFTVTDDDIATGTHQLMAAALENAAPVPGAIEAVHALASAGVGLGVVSSAVHHPFLEWALAKFGILDRFGTVVTSAGSGYYKSRPEIYWTALNHLGAEAKRSVHIGDSARFDVEGAARAGMRTVWLRKPSAAPPTVTPSLTLETLQDSAGPVLRLLRDDRA